MLDMTERLHFHFPLSCIGEGNGNPLQCSCLENSRDGEVWWAAVDGVAQSWTRLKRLGSSIYIHIYIYNGILFSCKIQRNPTVCNNMDWLCRHYAKWNKSTNKDKYYMILLNCGIYFQKIIEKQIWLVITQRWEGRVKGSWRKEIKRYKPPIIRDINTKDAMYYMITIANVDVWYTGKLHHKENFFSFLLFCLSYLYEKTDVSWIYSGHHFTKYVNQAITLYALDLCSDLCQLFLYKLEKP